MYSNLLCFNFLLPVIETSMFTFLLFMVKTSMFTFLLLVVIKFRVYSMFTFLLFIVRTSMFTFLLLVVIKFRVYSMFTFLLLVVMKFRVYFPNSALKDAKTRCEQTLASCHKLLEASSLVVLAEHKAAMSTIDSLCSQVDAQPLTPLILPAIRYAIPPAHNLLDDILNKIGVSLCGEERTEEATRQDSPCVNICHQHGEKEREMFEEDCSEKETVKFSRRISGDENLSRRPLRWTLAEKDVHVELTLPIDQQPTPKSVPTLCEEEPSSCEVCPSASKHGLFDVYTPSDDEEF